nr:hypothetical protein HK105_003296 [Polyrhizophydium stewartii]
MENRPEYLAMTMGLAKLGVTVALINTNLTADLLRHSIGVSGARVVIASTAKLANVVTLASAAAAPAAAAAALAAIAPATEVWWYAGQDESVPAEVLARAAEATGSLGLVHRALDAAVLDASPETRLPPSVRDRVTSRTPLYYIFTSGTTGPSKAAKFSHRRFIGAAVTWAAPSGLKTGDRYYITLPLYHGNAGVVAVAPCYLLGNTIVLREKFSVRSFFDDIHQNNCVATVYIGELWRYLHTMAPQPHEGTPEFSPLRVIVGNGLRVDLWATVCRRFHITQVVEHYGSTEMPGDAVLNYFNKPGSCGFLPAAVAREKSMTGEGGRLVAYDVEADRVVRGADGRCVPTAPGETGEMIMRLPGGVYDGYVGEAATRRKLYEDVFEAGDRWWSSGDLLRTDAQGFFYFVDRTGDSFRWKGENVSTHEVEMALATFPGVKEVNGESAAAEHSATGTLKLLKYAAAAEGYSPARTGGDRVFVNAGGAWHAVDEQVAAQLDGGQIRL